MILLTLDEIRAAWPGILNDLRRERGILASLLQRAQIISIDEREMRIVLPSMTDFQHQQLKEEAQQELLNRVAFGSGESNLCWSFRAWEVKR